MSIWLAGVALGAALLIRDLHLLRLPLALIAAIALTSMLAGELGWADGVQIALDAGFCAFAVACAWRMLRAPRNAPLRT